MNETSWILELDVPGMQKPLQVSFSNEITIGRGGAGAGGAVDVDLSPYNAIEKGVSRQHIRIFVQDDQLFVTDLNTANGTMLNDKRLSANEQYHLANDDQIVLGALRMLVRITGAPSYENVPRKQTDIAPGRPGEKPGHGEMILIVEDHVELAQLFSMMLQRQGFVTQISRDANRAMHFLESRHPDAVILDLMLPGIDGIEICRFIRRDSRMDDTPIIIVSANKDQMAIDEVLEAGADIFLKKPINAAELGSVIHEYIGHRRKHGGQIPIVKKDATKALSTRRLTDNYTPPRSVRDDMVAVIVSGYADRPFSMSLNKPMTIGRTTSTNPTTHVDLSRYQAGDKGVSRVHAVLSYEDSKFFIEDAGSLNGTYINGQRIPPNQPMLLNSGNEVRLGSLSMYLYFHSDTPAIASSQATQPETAPLTHADTQEVEDVHEPETEAPPSNKKTDKLPVTDENPNTTDAEQPADDITANPTDEQQVAASKPDNETAAPDATESRQPQNVANGED